MFNHTKQLNQFLQDQIAGRFTNDSPVAVVERSPLPCYRCIGVHHLSGLENETRHHLFLEVLDYAGQRRSVEQVQWGWTGQRPDQLSRPVNLDKPASEPAGDIALHWGMEVWAQVLDQPSDRVAGITTALASDEPGRSRGHHSHYVVWMWVDAPLTDDPPPGGIDWQARYEALAGQVLEIAEGIDRTYRYLTKGILS